MTIATSVQLLSIGTRLAADEVTGNAMPEVTGNAMPNEQGSQASKVAGGRLLDGRVRRHGLESDLLRGRLQHRNWPSQLRFEEPTYKGRQDDWRETDHDGKDQQARTADRPVLEKPVADEKQDMSEGSGG